MLELALAVRGTFKVGKLAVSWFMTNVCVGSQSHKLFIKSGQGSMESNHSIRRPMQRQSSLEDLPQIAISSH
jgi:hypothetical protein